MANTEAGRSSGYKRSESGNEPAFTRSEYVRMLQLARASGYEFRTFARRHDAGERVCLMRHDVDIDVGAAAAMAEVEARNGVLATYFLMLRSPVYNLFSRANHRFVERILELGHAIGLHFDQGFAVNDRPVAEAVMLEAEILERIFRTEVRVVSFHQPGPAVLENEIQVAPLVNTYDREDMQGYEYVSDSNMLWRAHPACDIFSGVIHPRLHLLIHPLWWMADEPGTTTEEAFDRALLANWTRAQEQMLSTERAYGPRRRFEIVPE